MLASREPLQAVQQRDPEAALAPQRGGRDVDDGVLHGDVAHPAHGRVLHRQVQRAEREHEARGGVDMARRGRRRRQAQRRRPLPDHPHLELLMEATERGRRPGDAGHQRGAAGDGGRGDGGRRGLLGLGLELLDAVAQLGDVGGGVREEGRLVHPGHRGHGGPELAEAAVELVAPLPLRLHVADDGTVRPGPGLPAPPLRWCRCQRLAGAGTGLVVDVVLAGRARALVAPPGAVIQAVVAPQPSLQELAGHEVQLRVMSGRGEGGRRRWRGAGGGGPADNLIHCVFELLSC